MKKFIKPISIIISFILIITLGYSQQKHTMAATKPELGVATTKQTGNLVDIIVASKNHSTLLAALKAASLVDALQATGPFTVLAPDNDAFAKIPVATLDNLLKPENKSALSKILTSHVLNGNINSDDFLSAIKNGNGSAIFTTLSGEKLTATLDVGKIKITDNSGNNIFITTPNIVASNGVVHTIDAVIGSK